jgi:hypothetical protein
VLDRDLTDLADPIEVAHTAAAAHGGILQARQQ